MELQSLIQLSSKAPAVAANPSARPQARDYSRIGPCAGPRDLNVPIQSPHHLFFNVFYNFGFQTSYKLGLHWLFILFFRTSVSCPKWVHKQVGSAPTYLSSTFSPNYCVIMPCLGCTLPSLPQPHHAPRLAH